MTYYQEIIRALEIFSKYSDVSEEFISAEHDEIYSGPDPEIVSAEDLAELKELGWNPSEFSGSFYKFV